MATRKTKIVEVDSIKHIADTRKNIPTDLHANEHKIYALIFLLALSTSYLQWLQ